MSWSCRGGTGSRDNCWASERGRSPGSGSPAPGQPAVVPRVPSAVAVLAADTDDHADLDQPDTAPADAVVIGVEVVNEDGTKPRVLAADAPAKLDTKEREESTTEELSADMIGICLLYTSDAADDLTRVDL